MCVCAKGQDRPPACSIWRQRSARGAAGHLECARNTFVCACRTRPWSVCIGRRQNTRARPRHAGPPQYLSAALPPAHMHPCASALVDRPASRQPRARSMRASARYYVAGELGGECLVLLLVAVGGQECVGARACAPGRAARARSARKPASAAPTHPASFVSQAPTPTSSRCSQLQMRTRVCGAAFDYLHA